MSGQTFEPGDRVVFLKGGPFEGYEGVVQSMETDEPRVVVALSLFGREAPIRAAASELDWVDDLPDDDLVKRLGM